MKPDQLNLFKETPRSIASEYRTFFTKSPPILEVPYIDPLMKAVGIEDLSDYQLRRQYYSRHLGAMWERLVRHACGGGQHVYAGEDTRLELADVIMGEWAIECKYRVGSGEPTFGRRLANKGIKLQERGYRPVLLVARSDSLPILSAIAAKGNWLLLQGAESFRWIEEQTGVDVQDLV